MGLLKTLLLALSSGGGVVFEFLKTHTISSVYNLCSSVPVEEIILQLTSIATLSISEIRLVVQPPSISPSVCTLADELLTPTPTSTYSLATAVT